MTKPLFLIIAVISAAFCKVQGLSCKTCAESQYRYYYKGEQPQPKSCFDAVKNEQNTTCTGSSYCLTRTRLNGDLERIVERECVDPNRDYDPNSNVMPNSTKCVLNGHTYNTTLCNNKSVQLTKRCQSDCNYLKSQGKCNYISGNCVCNPGFSGENCSISTETKPARSCVQCNEAIEPSCGRSASELPTGTLCANDSQYCATRKSFLIDLSGNVAKTITTRSCSIINFKTASTFQRYSGSLSNIYTVYNLLHFCDSDNCNTGTPSKADTELWCIQCSDSTGGSCEIEPEPCPINARYCYSSVDYFIKTKPINVNAYRNIGVKRGCAVDKMKPTGCTSTTVPGTDLQRVSCYETCTTNICNTGWPARPKCAQCQGSYFLGASPQSVSLPGVPPQSLHCFSETPTYACRHPYHEFCSLKTRSVSSDHGLSLWIERGCSVSAIPQSCSTSTIMGAKADYCTKTCKTPLCNKGIRVNSGMFQTLFPIVIVTKLMYICY